MTQKAALYCRLSVDDGNLGGSVSIETQKIMLAQYCNQHAISDYEYFCDDGASGTNFERPAFQDMYRAIQNGEIGMVIVKDLSRFGRNYIEVGAYVREFEEHGVRFIAADDNYDSATSTDDFMFPMKNVINEMYAREVSRKTKSAKKAKAQSGQFIGSKPPFGYKLDPNDRHHLIPDEPAAELVRRIFRMFAQGIGYNKMAKIFREEHILTPIAYFNQHNPDYFRSDYWRKEFDWHVTSIRAILNNEVYLGKLIYGKQRNKGMKSKHKVKNPKQDWIVTEGCHEPIITQELWDSAHKVMDAKHRPSKTGEVQMFAGLLYCSDCGHALTYSQKQRKDGTYHGSYSCWLYKTHGKDYCPSHYITFDVLYDLVLCDLQSILKWHRSNEDEFYQRLCKQYKGNAGREVKKMQEEYERRQKRSEELNRIMTRLYEDVALDRISQSQYEMLAKAYEDEQNVIRRELTELKAQMDKSQSQDEASEKFAKAILRYTMLDHLDAEILNELIDKIVVHHREETSDGQVIQQIEIYYRYIGKIDAYPAATAA